MKSINTIFKIAIFLIIITGCRNDKHFGTDGVLFDVESFPTVETAGKGVVIPDISESLGRLMGYAWSTIRLQQYCRMARKR